MKQPTEGVDITPRQVSAGFGFMGIPSLVAPSTNEEIFSGGFILKPSMSALGSSPLSPTSSGCTPRLMSVSMTEADPPPLQLSVPTMDDRHTKTTRDESKHALKSPKTPRLEGDVDAPSSIAERGQKQASVDGHECTGGSGGGGDDDDDDDDGDDESSSSDDEEAGLRRLMQQRQQRTPLSNSSRSSRTFTPGGRPSPVARSPRASLAAAAPVGPAHESTAGEGEGEGEGWGTATPTRRTRRPQPAAPPAAESTEGEGHAGSSATGSGERHVPPDGADSAGGEEAAAARQGEGKAAAGQGSARAGGAADEFEDDDQFSSDALYAAAKSGGMQKRSVGAPSPPCDTPCPSHFLLPLTPPHLVIPLAPPTSCYPLPLPSRDTPCPFHLLPPSS